MITGGRPGWFRDNGFPPSRERRARRCRWVPNTVVAPAEAGGHDHRRRPGTAPRLAYGTGVARCADQLQLPAGLARAKPSGSIFSSPAELSPQIRDLSAALNEPMPMTCSVGSISAMSNG